MIVAFLAQYLTAPVLKWAGILLAVVATIAGIKKWGRNAERADQMQYSLSNSFDRARINANVAAGVDTGDKWLRAPSQR